MSIEWPPFRADDRMLDHPATEKDIAAGRAAFVLRDKSGRLVGTAVNMGLPRLGFAGEERRLGVAVQVEAAGEKIVVGVRHGDGDFSVVTANEFESAPRFLVLYHKPNFGINDAERALAKVRGGQLNRARRDDVLAVRWKQGPVLFVRHATGDVAAQEAVRLGTDSPHARELLKCDAVFEVSFLNLDEVLDESVSLLDLQGMFEKELPRGFEYLGWNGSLRTLGKR